MMDTDWVEYKCKSGETLFIYNKVTGEHKWPTDDSADETCIMIGQPVVYKEWCTIGTQTDDNGCNNGCTSIYTKTADIVNSTEASIQQENCSGDEGFEPFLDNGYCYKEERSNKRNGCKIEVTQQNSLAGESSETTDGLVINEAVNKESICKIVELTQQNSLAGESRSRDPTSDGN
ncbi:hypothetical protein AC249_AIPGENE17999 [Exaiptasia diaphana]|nr:hypothetical protein AC249_AIPGENE17999 [Exaiptasia diaphana]